MDSYYDLLVIGSGPAGEKGAARAAYEGKRVAMVEGSPVMGGAMDIQGVPAKTLREAALDLSGVLKRGLYGVDLRYPKDLDVQTFLYHERQVQSTIQEMVAANMARHGVQVYQGWASFEDLHHLHIAGEDGETVIGGDVILIATGSRPLRPPSFPFHHPSVYDSSTILNLRRLPRDLIVVGGGIVGCEFACLFSALGLPVHLVHSQEELFPFVDREIAGLLRDSMRAMGITLHLGSRVNQTTVEEGSPEVRVALSSGQEIHSEALLASVGRASNTEKLRLENAGVQVGERGLIKVNEFFQTNVPHIYAAGDVIGFPALTSTSMEQGRMAVTHAFGFHYPLTPAGHIPYGIWTIPEISMVGETEETLRARGQKYLTGRVRFNRNPRGLVLGEDHGLLKLLFSADDLKLLGVHIIGQEACELVATGLLALETGATAYNLINLCFNFPSLADMYKYAAYDALGEYRNQ